MFLSIYSNFQKSTKESKSTKNGENDKKSEEKSPNSKENSKETPEAKESPPNKKIKIEEKTPAGGKKTKKVENKKCKFPASDSELVFFYKFK